MHSAVAVEDVSESIKRKREPHHARRLACGLLSGVAGMLAACTQGRRRRHRPRQRPGRRIRRTVDFPIFYVKPPDSRGPGRRHARASVRRGRRLLRHAVEARPRLARRSGDRASPRDCASTARPTDDRYDIKDLDVSPDGMQVVFAMRGPLDDDQDEEEPPTWNIWEYDIATDTLHRVITSDIIAEEGQDVAPPIYPTAASCSPRRASASPRPSCSTKARRSSKRHRSAQRIRVRAARDERRRHRHPPDLLQPEQRPVAHGAAERPRAVHALGSRAGQRRHAPVHLESRRHRPAAATTARSRTTPARRIRPRQPTADRVHARARDAATAASWRSRASAPTSTSAAT